MGRKKITNATFTGSNDEIVSRDPNQERQYRGAALGETDICAIIPQSFCTGEPGDPLSMEVRQVCSAMAIICYFPLDFGECDDNSVELWFVKADSRKEAASAASQFIELNGQV